jgi:hypothetical protein
MYRGRGREVTVSEIREITSRNLMSQEKQCNLMEEKLKYGGIVASGMLLECNWIKVESSYYT